MTTLLGLIAALSPSDYLDVKSVIANAIGTIFGGIFLTIFYFVLAEKLLRLPGLSGSWILETVILQTEYNPFKRMVLRYKILLLQDGARLHGTAEKVFEKSDKERVFIGANRTTASIEGTVRKSYLGRSSVYLHAIEQGENRSFSLDTGSEVQVLWPSGKTARSTFKHCRQFLWHGSFG
jgi:hypothetical protein